MDKFQGGGGGVGTELNGGSSSYHSNNNQHTTTDDDHDYDDVGENDDTEMLLPGNHDEGSTKKRTPRPKSMTTTTTSTSISSGATDNNNNEQQNQKVSSRSSRQTKKKQQQLTEQKTDKVIKYLALFLLVAQMVGLVLLMRYSRTVPRPPDVPLYLASTAVYIMEVMKLIICIIVIMIQAGSVHHFFDDIKVHIFQSPMEILKLCVPSLLYTIQNNLLYLALTNLDAATYQVCYQLKILTTAVFSAILLDRKFSSLKWFSLVILTVGVAIVEISGSGEQQHHETNSGTTDTASAAAAIDATLEQKNRWIGLLAVVCAACTSGFSGVYFEKILKGSNTSLWIRNVQMGLPSVFIAYLTVYMKDSVEVQKNGFLGGYTNIVWTVVIVQAVGGLIVATVVKYADNVLKVFATSFSIVVSCIISVFMFDFHPTFLFVIGASFVVLATVLYSSPERKVRRKTILPITNKSRK